MRFLFRTAAQIVFGRGEIRRAPELVSPHGRRLLLVTGSSSLERMGALSTLEDGLARRSISWTRWRVDREPDTELVDEGARLAREHRCEAVLAVGGGSALDAAKAVAVLATHGGSALEYLEDLPGAGGRTIDRAPLPLVCAPTTAGSGSEVTRNAVLLVREAQVKRSMRSDRLLPRVALVDPDLAAGAPRAIAANAGMDALTHLVEAYVSTGAGPLTDALALHGIALAASAIRALADDRVTTESQEAMALASLLGGIALANAGLGAAHGLVAPLSGRCGVPHGAGCACLLPGTVAANVRALRRRAPASPALARYSDVAGSVAQGGGDATPERAVTAIDELRGRLGIGGLAGLGVRREDLPAVVSASRGGSMKYNPVALTDDELSGILALAMEPVTALPGRGEGRGRP